MLEVQMRSSSLPVTSLPVEGRAPAFCALLFSVLSSLGAVAAFGAITTFSPAASAQEQSATPAPNPGAQEKSVKDAKKTEAPKVQAEETKDQEGVKTYKFGEVEVEGRLKAPQILYFLRRVRAEFRAGLLGHRSFLPELSDTRRSPALR